MPAHTSENTNWHTLFRIRVARRDNLLELVCFREWNFAPSNYQRHFMSNIRHPFSFLTHANKIITWIFQKMVLQCQKCPLSLVSVLGLFTTASRNLLFLFEPNIQTSVMNIWTAKFFTIFSLFLMLVSPSPFIRCFAITVFKKSTKVVLKHPHSNRTRNLMARHRPAV